jgi:hypothetical protein
MDSRPATGAIGWVDLTVPDAEKLMEFYREVTGWTPEAVEMGGYQDFSMLSPETGQAVAGVCHARGPNAAIPPVWMIYIIVADLDKSLERCKQLGGAQVGEIRNYGPNGRYVMIQDPAGAYASLFQPPAEPQVA